MEDTTKTQSDESAIAQTEPRIEAPVPQQKVKKSSDHGFKTGGIIFLCFVASFLGSWVFNQSGLIDASSTNETITESRERVIAEGEVVADVAKTVAPSVVSILTESTTASYFGPTSQEGAGTGIIISADGYILTNKHVIPDGVNSVTVVLESGRTYDDVTVIGRDPLNDLAFLKIKNVTDLTPAKIGDSSTMSVGQKVVAIGNALGQYQTSVTSGIISGVGRPVTATDGTSTGTEQLENLFQTDAAINPGNSGGPLLNLNGEVIGINTAVAEDAEGIGFAIPINDAKGLIKGVLETGQISRAYLGVHYVTLNSEAAKELDVDREQGAYLGGTDSTPVISGSPAAKAGLKSGDIITKVNGTELTDKVTLLTQISQFTPGDEVTLTVLRDGKEITVKVTLEKLSN